MKKNISFIYDCYGCGVCSASCPAKIISIKLNKKGFYGPQIESPDKCVNCGICLDVCAFNYKDRALQTDEICLKSWAAWSNNELIRKKCSSGGIGFEIGKQLIENGYKAIGCRYDISKQRAEHYISNTVEEFIQSIGSKYIQSYTEVAFKQIKRKNTKYLITGTPCQIDSLRRMIRKFRCEENFVLMDFYCHCVPSMYAWKAYLKTLEPQIGKITYASWRNKFEYGWHDSYTIGIDGEKTSQPVNWNDCYENIIQERQTYIKSRKSKGDLFYKLFLGDIVIGPQCYKSCKYKYDKSSADIRIGDLWGSTYEHEQKGVSALVAFTQKGCKIIENLKDVTLIEHPFDIVAEGQMKENAHPVETSSVVIYGLSHGMSLDGIIFKLLNVVQIICTKLRLIFK